MEDRGKSNNICYRKFSEREQNGEQNRNIQ